MSLSNVQSKVRSAENALRRERNAGSVPDSVIRALIELADSVNQLAAEVKRLEARVRKPP